MTRRAITLAMTALAAGGCSMAPTYHRPAAPVAATLPQGPSYPALTEGDGAIDAIGWHAFFPDPRLQRVIATALASNRDLRAGIANVEVARAQYHVARAAQLPTINAVPSASRYHGSVSANGYTSGYNNSGNTTEAFGISSGFAAFEIDLWGRVRSQSRAAIEAWLASDEGHKAAQTALVAEVATAWATVGARADALAVARDTLASRQQSLDLARARETQGVGTGLAVAQAELLMQTAQSDLAAYTTALAQARNALQLLAGAELPAADVPTTLDDDAVLHSLPVGTPSAVLLRRPDVLAAEHQLQAANASIGAARAALFPTISLTSLVGLASGSLSGLFDQGGTFNYGIGGSATQTLFDGGAKAGNLAAARARHDAAVAQYEKAVQSAFSDVANALARRGTIDAQLAAQNASVTSAQRAATLTRARYDNGVDTSLAALDAERTVYAARQSLVATRLERVTNMVTLYAVLGGGLKP
ncbi:efflux transporter outer membrane subunit [Novosphingobium sp.]|uniref:efflux transporter outer membrane subunit n=1 Tax=Novosphingobium sp. TaxID=1874826 RepID=UPI00333E1C8D